MLRWMRWMSIVAAVSVAAGCAAPIVNVPPLPGDVAFHSPNTRSIVAIQVSALQHVLQSHKRGEPYAIRLPAGTTIETYRLVAADLPEGLTTVADYGGAVPTFRVEQIYMRGTTGRVDIVRPNPITGEELVSVLLAIDIEGWYAHRSKVWRIPVDQALAIVRARVPEGGAEGDPLPEEPMEPAPAPAPAPQLQPEPAPAPEQPDVQWESVDPAEENPKQLESSIRVKE